MRSQFYYIISFPYHFVQEPVCCSKMVTHGMNNVFSLSLSPTINWHLVYFCINTNRHSDMFNTYRCFKIHYIELFVWSTVNNEFACFDRGGATPKHLSAVVRRKVSKDGKETQTR